MEKQLFVSTDYNESCKFAGVDCCRWSFISWAWNRLFFCVSVRRRFLLSQRHNHQHYVKPWALHLATFWWDKYLFTIMRIRLTQQLKMLFSIILLTFPLMKYFVHLIMEDKCFVILYRFRQISLIFQYMIDCIAALPSRLSSPFISSSRASKIVWKICLKLKETFTSSIFSILLLFVECLSELLKGKKRWNKKCREIYKKSQNYKLKLAAAII